MATDPNPDPGALPVVLDVGHVADLMHVSVNTTYAELGAGRIPFAFKFGAQWRIPRDAFLKWLEEGGLEADVGPPVYKNGHQPGAQFADIAPVGVSEKRRRRTSHVR